ncbi:hypothetical protein P691DRAFT_809469 [Macrolepiota fuliginosa MF-IS2]|uniref:Uncharacterized protein n=1 Tax=Macrolepiota fuliginosa MF-IS2 TaxID=1400762 RepID=A0A9P5XJ94_9AGAR|nr:hypothetical protein P691DRAFT_809469 [Macrolepiota fuliginosa MF-IS2]
MEKVYTQVLPKHRETLEHLQLGHFFERLVWYDLPTEMQFAELVKCQKLWSLRVHLAIKAGDDLTPLVCPFPSVRLHQMPILEICIGAMARSGVAAPRFDILGCGSDG